MTEDLQKRAMAVDYAVKLSANVSMLDGEIAVDSPEVFMSFVEAIYNFLNGEIK